MAKEIRQKGVELHGKSYRYRMRVMEQGGKRVAAYKRWPFVEGAAAKGLAKNDPLRRENALAQANAYALKDHQARKGPLRPGGIQDAEGTLLEWLIRYQVEALELRRYNPIYLQDHLARIDARIDRQGRAPLPSDPVPTERLPFQLAPRSQGGIDHDTGQIRTLIRLARSHVEIHDMLHTHVQSLGPQHIHQLLAVWSNGKAKPKTKRRLITTLSSVWNHHEEFYGMRMAHGRPWATVKILGDGSKAKARAIPRAELAKIEAELNRLHRFTRGAIEFLRWTGARRGEGAKLRWEKIVWPDTASAAPSAHFERTKAARGTYRARFVYLEDGCLAALARMLKPQDDEGNPIDYDPDTFDWRTFDWPKEGWVFPAPETPKNHISGETVYQAFVRCVRYAGVPHASPHMLRHTKATVLTATVPQAMAQEMLGHEDASTFAIYRHLAEEAGYMVKDKTGQLVNADELKSRDDILAAMKKLPKEDRAALLVELMGG